MFAITQPVRDQRLENVAKLPAIPGEKLTFLSKSKTLPFKVYEKLFKKFFKNHASNPLSGITAKLLMRALELVAFRVRCLHRSGGLSVS